MDWLDTGLLTGPVSALAIALVILGVGYKLLIKKDADSDKSQQAIIDLQSKRIQALETRQTSLETEARECHTNNIILSQKNTELALKIATLTEQVAKMASELQSVKVRLP